jgi:hypothetical protein
VQLVGNGDEVAQLPQLDMHHYPIFHVFTP